MPELPEVEIIRRQLEKYLIGKKVVQVDVRKKDIVHGDLRNVLGSTFLSCERYGKGLVLELDNDYSLAVHLKMSGQIVYRGLETKELVLSTKVGVLPGKFTHVIFELCKDRRTSHLYYNDVRQFGWIKILRTDSVCDESFFKNLGPEPSFDSVPSKAMRGKSSRKLTLEYFENVMSSSRSPVKNLLMNQHKIGGIGNIYANDALWKAKIDPRKPAKEISKDGVGTLYVAIHDVMKHSLEVGAASENMYVDALGQEGGYQNHFLVYHREGKKCSRCGTIIKRFTLGGRGTFCCPVCQR